MLLRENLGFVLFGFLIRKVSERKELVGDKKR